ncbi:hypothetical protein ACFL3G_11310 [Planctomycetota bacterium]
MKRPKSQKKPKPKPKRTPYSKCSDDEKVARNWIKAKGLFGRGEYSVAIIRCGICVELIINFAVRQELVGELKCPLNFVNKLLKSANGLRNKYHNLFLPMMEEYEEHDSLKELWRNKINQINNNRNAIAHSGEFRSKSVAHDVMQDTYEVLKAIMDLFEHKAKFKNVEI